jgi:ribosome maturation factor RimP
MNAQPHTDDTARDAGTDRTRDAIDPVADLRALERVIEPVVRTMGYELVHLEWAGRALRVYIDRAEGITLADCAKLSPILSTSLDAAEHDDESADVTTLRRVLAGAYHLEVSSPGLDRPLMRATQFRRFVGSRAHVRTHAPLSAGASQKNFHGRIVAVDPDPASPDDEHTGVVRLADQDDPEVVHLVPLTLIKRANLIYEGDL